MTLLDPTFMSYSDTTINKRAVIDAIPLITPMDTPIIARFGLSGGTKFPLVNWPSTSVEWFEDDFMPNTATMTTASVASDGATITVSDASAFQVGDVVKAESEYVVVTARNVSTNVLTISRAQGGTTAATHASDTALTIVGNARAEGATNDVSSVMDITSRTNYCQILHRSIEASRTAAKMSNYGLDDYYEYQMNKSMKEVLRRLEQTLIYGKPQARSASVNGMLGGIQYWLTLSGANTVSAGGAVVQDDFDEALRLAYLDGGAPTVAITHPNHLKVIKNFYDSSSFLRIERTENTVGMEIERVHTPYGDVELLSDRHMPTTEIYLIDPDHFGILPFDPFFEEELAKTGDKKVGEIVGEYTCVVRYPTKAHAAITAIS